MNAKDVMTSNVVSIGLDASVGDAAGILLARGVSALPVLDGDELVGIVSEGDLIRRAEIGTAERPRSWWLRLFAQNATLAKEFTKSHAEQVRDLMTRDVVTVGEETPLAEVADILERKRIKRVPVMRGRRLVGIVSRADLIRGLAVARTALSRAAPLDDGAIRAKLLESLHDQAWSNLGQGNVTVENGVVELWGMYASQEERAAARVAAESIVGPGKVVDHRAPIPEVYGFA
jgi:CBS domain-containing protein